MKIEKLYMYLLGIAALTTIIYNIHAIVNVERKKSNQYI